MLLLDVILCSLDDHTHIADLFGLLQYVSSDTVSCPDGKITSDVGSNDDFLRQLRISETLMKILLRNMGFFTVSNSATTA